MRVHYLQHVPFEGLGSIEAVLKENGHSITVSRMYENDPFPKISELDWLIIMGGPMGVQGEGKYPWLKAEKQFIKDMIQSGKIVIGICLGAQLLADVMGAKVYKNKYPEIGWFNINLNPNLDHTLLKNIFPKQIKVFHWHGDTFDIPKGAVSIGSSEATPNQGFILDNRIIALQFHLETTKASVGALIENCGEELDGSRYVQNELDIMQSGGRINEINLVMKKIIKAIEKVSKS